MNNGQKMSKRESFFKRRTNMKMWRRLLLAAGSVIVFVTTYLLILPAITADRETLGVYYDDSAASGGGFDVVFEEGDSGLNEDETSVSDSSDETDGTEETTAETDENGETASQDGETEETSDEAAETSTETDENGSAENNSSESGGSGGVAKNDGAIITITLDEAEEADKTEEEALAAQLNTLVLLAENTTGASITVSGANDDGSYSCTYDPDSGLFDTFVAVNFVLPVDLLEKYEGDVVTDSNYSSIYKNGSNSYTITLPSDIILKNVNHQLNNDDGSYAVHPGYDTGTGQTILFYYYFEPVKDGNGDIIYDENNEVSQWQIVMVFTDSMFTNSDLDTITGRVKLEAFIDKENYKDNKITVSDADLNFNLVIDTSDIDFGSESINSDIMITKKGNYNAADGTVTYEIMVLSRNGTDDIAISDVIPGFEDIAKQINGTFEGMTYKTGIVGVYNRNDQNLLLDETGLNNSVETAIEEGTEGSEAPYYYFAEDGSMKIALPALGGQTSTTSYGYDAYSAYVLTYTYNVNPSETADVSFTNKATATTNDNVNPEITISDSAEATITVSHRTMITKTGQLINDDTEIEWTITIGDRTTSLNGYRLVDSAFANLTADDLTVKAVDKEGNQTVVTGEENYKVVHQEENAENPHLIEITGEATQYIITYKTTVNKTWESQTIENYADLLIPEDGDVSDTGRVTVPGIGGNFSKTLTNAEASETEGLYLLSWNAEIQIPESGIPAGVVYTDTLTGSDHYITYAQAQDIITALNEAWGKDNIEIKFFYNTGSNDGIVVNNLLENDKYYKFTVEILNKIEYSTAEGATNKIAFSYQTTADTSSVADSETYKNSLHDTVNPKEDSWTYNNKVVKYGYSGSISNKWQNSSDTTETNGSFTTDNNGTIYWLVKVVFDETGTYTITDTLPAGVTLSKVYYGKWDMNNLTEIGESGASDDDLLISYSTSADSTAEDAGVTVTANVKNLWSTKTLYVRFECTIDDLANADTSEDGTLLIYDSDDNLLTQKTYSYKNQVTVKYDNEDYGSDEQTSTIIWKEETQDDNDDEKDVDKNYLFSTDNVLTYTIAINPDGENYTYTTTYYDADGNEVSEEEEFDELTIKDSLSYPTYPKHGIVRSVDLILNTLVIYTAEKDSNGNLVKGEKLDPIQYSWNYSESTASYDDYDMITKNINLTVPNGQPLIFEYQYKVTVINDPSAVGDLAYWKDEAVKVSNNVALSINGHQLDSAEKSTDENVEDSSTSGSAEGAVGYTLYKMDADNFSTTLKGAVFSLYVYNADTNSYDNVGSFETNQNGYFALSGTANLADETSDDIISYTVKFSNGDTYDVPVNTMCYLKETTAPEGYKLDSTRHYLYFGKNIASLATSCTGYDSSDEKQAAAQNVIIPHTEYVSDEHSSDYYANKTAITVVKKWLEAETDADGNVTYTEISNPAGSVKFQLYQLFKDVNGNVVGAPDTSGSGGDDDGDDDEGGGGGGGSTTSSTLDWKVTSYGSEKASGTVRLGSSREAIISFSTDSSGIGYYLNTWDNTYSYWNCDITITDQDGNTLYNQPYSTTKVNEFFDYEVHTFTYPLTVPDNVTGITINVSGNVSSASVTGSGVEETTTEATTESSGGETGGEGTGGEGTTTGKTYLLHFTDLNKLDSTNYPNEGTYLWEVVTEKGENTGTLYQSADGYFTFYGNLSPSPDDQYDDTDHGKAVVEIDGKTVDLSTCLKMESITEIKFTTEDKGILTLVFSNGGQTDIDAGTTISNSAKIDGQSFSTQANSISVQLSAGEHTITKSGVCYLFCLTFEEGGILANTDYYTRNFDTQASSGFFEVAGDTANNKGTVIYNDVTYNNCLKMNSKASITFDNNEDGTVVLVVTNPNDSPSVGVNFDGTPYYGVPTGEFDSNGNEIYIITIPISSGQGSNEHHTITRINKTEIMLYYLAYIPDTYTETEWREDDPSNYQYAEYAVPYGEPYTLSTTENSFKAVITNLPWEVLDEDGNLLGYYSYYVKELTEGYTTVYMNNLSTGVESGTIAIGNIDKDSSTSISVVKNWLSNDNQNAKDDHTNDTVAFDLYQIMNLSANATEVTRSESHVFTTYDSDFYTISSGSNVSTNYGTAVYNDETYTSCLKTEGSTSIKFTAPADGTLTLVFGSNLPYSATADYTAYSYGFLLNGTSYRYKVDIPDETLNELKGQIELEAGQEYNKALNNLIYEYLKTLGTVEKVYTDPNYKVNLSSDAVVFTVELEAGEYEIKRDQQCYLFYMDYTYNYADVASGILHGSYEITAADDWQTAVNDLPLYIKNSEGEIVGFYSYKVVETSPDETSYDISYSYDQAAIDDERFGDDLKAILSQDNDPVTNITAGSATITNQAASNEDGVELPSTGSRGREMYTLGGAILVGIAGLLLSINHFGRFRFGGGRRR